MSLLLRMTGISITELTEKRTRFLREAISNVSFANEEYYDLVWERPLYIRERALS